MSAFVVLLALHLLYILASAFVLLSPFVGADAAIFGSSGFDAAPADHPLVSGNGELLILLFCVSY